MNGAPAPSISDAPAARPQRPRPPTLRLLILALTALPLIAHLAGSAWSLQAMRRWGNVDLSLNYPGWGDLNHLIAVRRSGGFLIDGDTSQRQGAGLQGQDLITAVNGVTVARRPGVLYEAMMHGRPGDTLTIEWSREGRRMMGRGVLGPETPTHVNMGLLTFQAGSGTLAWSLVGPPLLLGLLFLSLGLLVGLVRIRDDVAFSFGLFLLVLGLMYRSAFNTPLEILWPAGLTFGTHAATALASGFAFLLGIRVFASFPLRTRIGAFALKAQWWVLAAFGVLAVARAVRLLAIEYEPLRPLLPAAQAILRVPRPAITPMLLTLLGLLLAAQWFAARRHPTRRARAFGVWMAVLFAAAVIGVVADRIPWSGTSRTQAIVALVLQVAVPIVLSIVSLLGLAHSIVAHRVFGLRVVVRRGLQHLLLSRGVLAVEFVALFLVLLQVLRGGQFEFSDSVPAVASLALTSAGLLVVGLGRINRPLMTTIDRRFFTEVCDARRVLLGLGEQVARLSDRGAVFERAGETVVSTLHPARIAFLGRTSDAWTSAWCREARGRPPVAVQCGVTSEEVARLAGPLAFVEQGRAWAECLVTREEVDAGRDIRAPASFELLIALRSGEELLGVMALAAKLSEEPYSREDKELLQAVAVQLGLALKNAELVEVAKREARQARDIEIARRVQQSLFPQVLPQPPGWDLAACCRPAREVGGDYYDLFEPAPGMLALALGDVSGKGLGASLLTASLHSTLRGRLPAQLDDLAGLMSEVNEHLVQSTPAGIFATLFVGLLDTATGRLRYVNGGHPAPMLLRAVASEPVLLSEGGPLVGILPGAPFTVGEVALAPGDVLLIYSDGLSEAMDAEQRMFEESGVLRALEAARSLDAEPVLHAVLDAADRFVAGAEQSDDISLVVARRTVAAPHGTDRCEPDSRAEPWQQG